MEELHLFIYGEIGGDPLFGNAASTVDEIQQKLTANPKATDVVVHISSEGGGVFDGWAIGNIIKNSGLKSTAKIEGLCASIATFIALSCDRVEMADVGRFMIHNPSNVQKGGEEDFKEAAEQLSKIKDDLLKMYNKKTGISIGQLSKMMDEETILTATEAKEQGFVDSFMTPMKAVAKFDIKNNKMPKTEKVEKMEKVDLSVLDRIIAKAEKLYKEITFENSEHNVMVTLEDGSSIFIESEDGELEGKNAFTVDENGEPTQDPVEDGTHALEDGRSITVEGGVVMSVQEAGAEVDLLKDQVKNLEKQIKDAQTEKETTDKAKNLEEEETKKTVMELVTEVKNLKTMTAGDNGDLKKPIINATNKFGEQEQTAHPLDNFALDLKKNR